MEFFHGGICKLAVSALDNQPLKLSKIQETQKALLQVQSNSSFLKHRLRQAWKDLIDLRCVVVLGCINIKKCICLHLILWGIFLLQVVRRFQSCNWSARVSAKFCHVNISQIFAKNCLPKSLFKFFLEIPLDFDLSIHFEFNDFLLEEYWIPFPLGLFHGSQKFHLSLEVEWHLRMPLGWSLGAHFRLRSLVKKTNSLGVGMENRPSSAWSLKLRLEMFGIRYNYSYKV